MTTFEQAKEGMKRAAQRQREYERMSIDEMEDKLKKQEDWMKDNPNHPMFSELESAYGHLKMVYLDKTNENYVKESLF